MICRRDSLVDQSRVDRVLKQKKILTVQILMHASSKYADLELQVNNCSHARCRVKVGLSCRSGNSNGMDQSHDTLQLGIHFAALCTLA